MSGGKTPVYTCHQNLANALDEFLNKIKIDELVQHSFVSSDLGSIDLVKPLGSLINIYLSTKFYHALFVCIIQITKMQSSTTSKIFGRNILKR